MTVKRLFLFAGYDAHANVSDALLFYLRELSRVGDIILTTDCDLTPDGIEKLGAISGIRHVQFGHHGEYDFGSYKRGFMWCENRDIIKSYDWIYFVNDSVLGPTTDIKPILENLENKNTDAVGMFYATGQWVGTPENRVDDHIQSWFIGVKSNIATQKYFSEFMHNISRHETKADIIMKYEVGFTKIMRDHKCSIGAAYSSDMSHDLYRTPVLAIQNGVCFIKKSALKYMTPSELHENVNPELLKIIQHEHLYKQKKYSTMRVIRLGKLRILTLKRRVGTNKTRWFLFDIFPLI